MTEIQHKIGFKATDRNMSCRSEKFIIGVKYSKPTKGKPSLCSSEGYHYCKNVIDIERYYPYSSNPRIFIIEDLGESTSDSEKTVTTSFRFLEEITEDVYNELYRPRVMRGACIGSIENMPETKAKFDRRVAIWMEENKERIEKQRIEEEAVKEYLEKERAKREEIIKAEEYRKKSINDANKRIYHLELVAKIQQKHPTAIIGGSIGLFLHTKKRLSRHNCESIDIDLILPYYDKIDEIDGKTVNYSEDKPSGSDFSECLTVYDNATSTYTKIEICISPTASWSWIEHEGVKYKVNSLENIWKAKLKYNKKKHIDDLYELMTK